MPPATSQISSPWSTWDRAFDVSLSGPERLKLVQEGFAYSKPQVVVRKANCDDLVTYIGNVLAETGHTLKVKQVRWFDEHTRCAILWEMADIGTFQAAWEGWSYAFCDVEGNLVSVADFWGDEQHPWNSEDWPASFRSGSPDTSPSVEAPANSRKSR